MSILFPVNSVSACGVRECVIYSKLVLWTRRERSPLRVFFEVHSCLVGRVFAVLLAMNNPAIPPPPTPEQAAAMAAAAHEFNVEVWTLLSFGTLVTLLRTYARVKNVGFKKLQPDDYLVWIALVRFYRLIQYVSHH